MLVHKFYLVDCIEVEFKFELNSNRFEWKQESESVILSFLSHSLFSQSFLSFLSHSFPFSVISLPFSVIPFLSQSFLPFSVIFVLSSVILSFSVIPQLDPTCRPLLPSSLALNVPRDLRRASLSGPARPGQRRRPTRGNPLRSGTQNPNPNSCVARGPPAPPPLLPRRADSLGLTVAPPLRRATDLNRPASAPPPRLEASQAQQSCPEPLHHRDSTKKSPPVSRSAPEILRRR
jgi:hypothetical protein